MSLVVKYCGGCNPLYDRVKLVKEISEILGVEPRYDEPKSGDICLLVSGCSRECLAKPEGVPTVQVSSYEPPSEIVKKIKEAQKKGTV